MKRGYSTRSGPVTCMNDGMCGYGVTDCPGVCAQGMTSSCIFMILIFYCFHYQRSSLVAKYELPSEYPIFSLATFHKCSYHHKYKNS